MTPTPDLPQEGESTELSEETIRAIDSGILKIPTRLMTASQRTRQNRESIGNVIDLESRRGD